MARLPVVGDDPGAWGDILNEFLEVAHNPDGTLSTTTSGVEYSVVDYGAVGDGVTNDSAAIQAAIDAAYTSGGGIVLIPGEGGDTGSRFKINATLELRTGVWLRGLGATTTLAGTANPMIQIKQDMVHDRMQISDLTLQSPAGVGIQLLTAGALQLGWPRITVENVTVVDAASHAFWVPGTNSVLETRFSNCVTLRHGGTGFLMESTDLFLTNCTAAEGGGGTSSHGFDIRGGNTKLAACKAYGNDGNGFALLGAGRHMLAACEAQDNVGYGYVIEGTWNTLAGCLADTDGIAGVGIFGNNNTVDGSFMYGGGGSGQTTKTGVFFGVAAVQNIVKAVTNCPAPVGGKAAGNLVLVGTATGARKEITYTTPWTPNPYEAETQAMTLTGNLTVVNPVYKHVGQRLTFEFRQDVTGTRTVTFPNEFRASWTPSTTGTHANLITFEYDGTAWQQVSSVVGLTPKPSIGRGDTFNRADETLVTSSSGHTWEKYNQLGGVWSVVSNQAKAVGTTAFRKNFAVLDAGVPDFTAEATIVTAAAGAGVVWRYTDSSNYYTVAGGTIVKVVAGVETTITSGLSSLTSGSVAKIVTSGPTHFLYKNGALLYTFADAFNVAATKVGIAAAVDTDVLDAFTIV